VKTALAFLALVGLLLGGCATVPAVDWNSRIGNYTYDQAVLDMGPPDSSAKLSDGVVVAEWLTQRGYRGGWVSAGLGFHHRYGGWVDYYETSPTPNFYLRLTFTPAGKLSAWRRVAK